jgi:hypothetical protein
LAAAAAARASVVVAVAHASVVAAAHASVEVAVRASEAATSADVRSAADLHSVQDETLAPDAECADLAISRFEVPSTDGTAAGVTVGVTIIAAGASSSAHRTSMIMGIMITATTVTIAGGSIAEQSAPAAHIGGAVTDYVRIENA